MYDRGKSPSLSPVVFREEVANGVTHGLGLLASLVGAFVLVSLSVEQGEAWHVVSAAVYGATLVSLYAASTLYHAFKGTRARGVLRVLDHCAIHLLIAGTYTPVTLVSMRGGGGWTLFGLAWGLAAVGIVFKVLAAGRFAVLSTVAYVLMGWLCIIAVKPCSFYSRQVRSHCSARVGSSTLPGYSSIARTASHTPTPSGTSSSLQEASVTTSPSPCTCSSQARKTFC